MKQPLIILMPEGFGIRLSNSKCNYFVAFHFTLRLATVGYFYFFNSCVSIIASLASLTSCTRNMLAPFNNPIVCKTVLPFKAFSAVPFNVL